MRAARCVAPHENAGERHLMIDWLRRYARWLHLEWPASVVEPLPEVDAEGRTAIPGVWVVGDLRGIPLLKFALDSGARAVERIALDIERAAIAPGPPRGARDLLDLVIVGAGVSGMAAAAEAKRRCLSHVVLEAAAPLATLLDFPTRKPIYTYPRAFRPAGVLDVGAEVKEALIEELESQIRAAGIEVTSGRAERIERDGDRLIVHLVGDSPLAARHVLVAIGRTGHFRRLGVPGEDRPHVHHRLHDPRDFAGQRALVVGGGDSAVETALALALAGGFVTLVHRGPELVRPKPENLEKLARLRGDPRADVTIEQPSDASAATPAGRFMGAAATASPIEIRLETRVEEIGESSVALRTPAEARESAPASVVFLMIGRDAPLDFFHRSRLAIANEMTPARIAGLALFLAFCAALYEWKSGGRLATWSRARGWFPFDLPERLASAGDGIRAAAADPTTLLGTLAISAAQPAFWYTLAYTALIVVFGVRRIRRRRTPYVTAQTWTLIAIQVLPLFLLPEILLPLLDARGLLPASLADALFPRVDYGHGREFWRAYGLILAWPLNVYNVFTPEPLPAWIAISVIQTFVLIPIAIFWFGKGAYCGWICSCGALAETLGDTHRHKMPHGPGWNRLNLAGQGVLAIAVVLLIVRVAGWILPDGNSADRLFEPWLKQPYQWTIDVFLAGVVGYGLYFWFSGRVWCRFFCPLAALMHVYARFSRFRIFAEKKKCISCGQCTRVCHQGIDVMSFANKGAPMADPQCVRCSACVHECPTGVLSFGRLGRGGLVMIDRLGASPVRMRERD